MDKQLVKELKDAGFPMLPLVFKSYPPLEELIENCGRPMQLNILLGGSAIASYPTLKSDDDSGYCLYRTESNPREAVAKLWLSLKKTPPTS